MDNTQVNNTFGNAPQEAAPIEQPVPVATPQEPTATPKKSKAPLIITVIIILILAAGGAVAAILLIGNNQKLNKYTENASQLSQKISSANRESLIFFSEDLEQISSELFKNPDGEKFASNSYATYFDGKAVICLNDGEYRVDNIDGEMQVKKLAESRECTLNLSDSDIMKYLNNYYAKKYNLTVREKDTKKYQDGYIVYTDKGFIFATFELKDHEVIIVDDYEELIAGYNSISDINELIIDYVDKAQTGKSEDDDRIVDIRVYNQEYFILQSTLPEQEALKFTEDLGEYLVGKNIKELELYTAAYDYDYVDGQTVINIEYKITLTITNGEMKIITSTD